MNQTDLHQPLRQDIRLLGDILGDVIVAREGEPVLNDVARIRELSQQARTGDQQATDALISAISSLDNNSLRLMAKAFNQFLNLANIAEQHHRIRRRKSYQRSSASGPQRGSLDELLPRLQIEGVDAEQVVDKLLKLKIDFVLTAHPTETQRRTFIQKYNAIANGLDTLDRPDLTEPERETALAELYTVLLSAWESDELRLKRPTPVDEARWGYAVVEQILWNAVPRFLRNLDRSIKKATGKTLPPDFSPIRFSSWMGGDRDGNPFVTATVTREVLLMGKWELGELLINDLLELQAELSMTVCSDELRKQTGQEREPYRFVLKKLIAELRSEQEQIETILNGGQETFKTAYPTVESIKDLLLLCYRSLVETGLEPIADGRLKDVLRKLTTFGRSLLRLDIRQDSSRHTQFIDNLTRVLNITQFTSLDEPDRCNYLLELLTDDSFELPSDFPVESDDKELIDTFRLIAATDKSSLGSYIISMAKKPSDVLAVALLQKIVGVKKALRVVPLFETLDDLDSAAETIRQLLEIDWYRERTKEQEVMIGYSDSAKDAGYLAASWAQYKAQEQLIAVCREAGVPLILFHGRGGSISRGGSPAHKALLSLPPGAIGNGLRVTEQGEVIRYKFGLPGIARRTLEIYLSAALEGALHPPKSPHDDWRQNMEQLSEESTRIYRAAVRADSSFADYFEQTTPIRELQEVAIGSRPAKRNRTGGMTSLRAIPWVFAWTQVRLMLPAWLGTQAIFDQKTIEPARIKEMFDQWGYFRILAEMQEMVLAKSHAEISTFYEKSLTNKQLHIIGANFREQIQLVINGWLDLIGKDDLLDDSPVIQRSIAVRNPYTDVLNLLQVEALRRTRTLTGHPDDDLRQALLLTIVGVAAGMRNTG